MDVIVHTSYEKKPLNIVFTNVSKDAEYLEIDSVLVFENGRWISELIDVVSDDFLENVSDTLIDRIQERGWSNPSEIINLD